MKHTDETRAENDKKVTDNIREYGCHVISVFDPEEKKPSFSYSVGVQETAGAPEIVVIGLGSKLGHFIVNEYKNQVKAGTSFKRGVLYSGFLEGFSVYIEPAKPLLADEYNFGCKRYYKDRPYTTVQLIYPTTAGIWPWQKKLRSGLLPINQCWGGSALISRKAQQGIQVDGLRPPLNLSVRFLAISSHL